MKLLIYILLDIAVGVFFGWVDYSNQISMAQIMGCRVVIDFGNIVVSAISGMFFVAAFIEFPVWVIWENYKTDKFERRWMEENKGDGKKMLITIEDVLKTKRNEQKQVSHAELVIYIHRRKMGYGEVDPRLEQAYAERAIDHPEQYREKYNECLKEAKAWHKSLDNDAKRHFKCLQKTEKF